MTHVRKNIYIKYVKRADIGIIFCYSCKLFEISGEYRQKKDMIIRNFYY